MKKQQHEELAELFLVWSGKEYKSIEKLLKQPYVKTKFNHDTLHDSIIKVHDIISRRGFNFINGDITLSGKSFLNYIFQAYSNNNLLEITTTKTKSDKSISIDEIVDENGHNIFDEVYNLQENDEEEYNQKLELMIKEDYTIDEIFLWVDKNFDSFSAGFFKMYFKNKISYKDIALITKYSESNIFYKVKKVRLAVMKEFSNVIFHNRK